MADEEPQGMEASFIRSLRGKRALKLLSLALAFALWLFVTGEKEDEVTLSVPVRIQNVPPLLAFVEEPPRSVQVRLTGSRSLLPFLFREELKFQLDGSRLKPGKNTLDLRYAKLNLSKGINVKAIEPEKITVRLEERLDKNVRIVADMDDGLENFPLERIEVLPPFARVFGPKSSVEKISRVFTQKIQPDFSGKGGEVVIKACPLDTSKFPFGVGITPDTVTVRLIFKESQEDQEAPKKAKAFPRLKKDQSPAMAGLRLEGEGL